MNIERATGASSHPAARVQHVLLPARATLRLRGHPAQPDRGQLEPRPGGRGATGWTALITAPYPEHPSGHLCLDSAHLRVLRMVFGTDKIRFGVTSSRFPDETRYFDRFSEPLEEITEARIWAGLHYRTADVQAQILGRKVAQYMAKHYFQPVN